VTLNETPKMITERGLEKVLEAGKCQFLDSVLVSRYSDGFWAERPRRNGARFPAGVKVFSRLHCVTPGSGAHTASYLSNEYRGLLPGGKAAGA
jgi:hypothetical protein